MNVMVLGADGFCRWPYIVTIKRRLSASIGGQLIQRDINGKYGLNSLTAYAFDKRIEAAKGNF